MENPSFSKITVDDIATQLSNLPQLTFEVTDACNLRCKYCGYGEFYEDYDKRENKMMSVDTALKLIDYLAASVNSLKKNTATASPMRLQFEFDDEFKVLYLAFRWIGTRGDYGPWTDIHKITIAR
jgi:predicted nucleic-acid-binding Zn-ribbon protein